MGVELDPRVIEVLKWAGIVFAAGFVGYFGRYLSQVLIARMRKGRDAGEATDAGEKRGEGAGESQDRTAAELEKERLKLEKKKAKEATKRHKKAGD
ncbi:MAG: hypothetical protein ACOC6A_02875 [Chloroflexota bacterium]